MVDFVGHGGSERAGEQENYTIPVMLRHLHQVIVSVAGNAYSILGYSMGGRIGCAYALKYEQEVKTLILESASFGIESVVDRAKRYEDDRRLAESILNNGIDWFERYWSEQRIFATQETLPDSVKNEIRQRRLQNDKRSLAYTLLGSGQGVFPFCGKQLEKVSFPVMYICGSQDEKYVNIGKSMIRKNFTFCSVNSAGHNVHVEQPDEYSKLVQVFLDDNDR